MSPETNGNRYGHQWSSGGFSSGTGPLTTSPENGSVFRQRQSQSVIFLDMFGVSYFIIYTVFIFVTSIIVTMPIVYEDSSEILTRRRWFAMFLTFNTVANYILTVRNRSNYKASSAVDRYQGLPDSNWQRCIDCQQSSPPRTHHCPLCNLCILKRDHHCFFTAACVGFYNQRYFLVLCFYATAGAVYGFYLTWQYVIMEYMHPLSSDFYHFFLPITLMECLFGYTTCMFTYIVMILYLSFITLLGCGGIFVWQFYIACLGISTHELSKGIRTYRSYRVWENLSSIFGPFWPVQFIVPLPFLKNQGDGIHWSQTSKYI